jgi:hypothetical protein
MVTFTPPIRRKDTAKGHHYVDADGRRVPGVTTIIKGGTPKDALINWAGNVTADYAVNNWDDLSKLPPAERLDRLRRSRYEARDTAGDKGTAVHQFAERLITGEAVDVPEELLGYVRAYAEFLDDFKVEPVYVEFSIASYTYGYAGTGDLIAWLEHPMFGRILTLDDIKTARSGIWGETALQLAGYRFADVLIPRGGSAEIPMPEVDACFGIHVTANGYSLRAVTADEDQHRQFLYVKEVADFAKDGADYVGPAVRPPSASSYRLVREES